MSGLSRGDFLRIAGIEGAATVLTLMGYGAADATPIRARDRFSPFKKRLDMVRHLTAAAIAALILFAVSVPFEALGAAMNRYGGPVYAGAPALGVTASLVRARGGAGHFSIATALT